jgi:hypothetical protein
MGNEHPPRLAPAFNLFPDGNAHVHQPPFFLKIVVFSHHFTTNKAVLALVRILAR